jgi:hypothetical protein
VIRLTQGGLKNNYVPWPTTWTTFPQLRVQFTRSGIAWLMRLRVVAVSVTDRRSMPYYAELSRGSPSAG